jgi:hypothetical protein
LHALRRRNVSIDGDGNADGLLVLTFPVPSFAEKLVVVVVDLNGDRDGDEQGFNRKIKDQKKEIHTKIRR